MEQDVVERIRENTSITALLASYGVKLHQQGAYRNKAICPFHSEKTPSFQVNEDTGLVHCFGCGFGGNVYTLVMKLENLSFGEALHRLGEWTGIPVSHHVSARQRNHLRLKDQIFRLNQRTAELYQELYCNSRVAGDYMRERGFSIETLERFRVGYAPAGWQSLPDSFPDVSSDLFLKANLTAISKKTGTMYDRYRDRVMFPVLDSNGQITGFAGRTLDPEEPAKYINPTNTPTFEKSRMLFGQFAFYHPLDMTNRFNKQNKVIVTEGYTDVMALHQHGLEFALGLGGTAMTEHQAASLAAFDLDIYLCLDADEAGQQRTIQHSLNLLRAGAHPRIIQLPEGEDPAQYIMRAGKKGFQERMDHAMDAFTFKLELLLEKYTAFSPDRKHTIIKEMVPLLKAPRDPVLRWLYIESLGKALSTSPKIVHEASRLSLQEEGLSTSLLLEKDLYTEQELLRCLVRWPPYRASVGKDLEAGMFRDPVHAELYTFLQTTPDLPLELASSVRAEKSQVSLFSGHVLEDLATILLRQGNGNLDQVSKDQVVAKLSDILFLKIPQPDNAYVDRLVDKVKQHHLDDRRLALQEKLLQQQEHPERYLAELVKLVEEGSKHA